MSLLDFATLQEARSFYQELGFNTLPLRHGAKVPIFVNWQSREPAEMWLKSPEEANIGIRCGDANHTAVLDCDEEKRPGTVASAEGWLAGLGFLPGDYPVVQTASGKGRHLYFTLWGNLDGNYKVLSAEFGAGELRYGPGSMVVACPSVIGSQRYALLDGDFRQLPHIAVADLVAILPIAAGPSLPFRKDGPATISAKAKRLLMGEGIEDYASRSEAEHALVTSLVSTGHDFDSVISQFRENPCFGKFSEMDQENAKSALRWLERSYLRALDWLASQPDEAKQRAQASLDWALSRPWPGRTGSVDRDVYLAHARCALRAGREEYGASVRELAEMAGVGRDTASKATRRLVEQELISPITPSQGDYPATYQLCAHNRTLLYSKPVKECPITRAHDAFRRNGLGKSAEEIWEVLQVKPTSAAELAAVTGRHPGTIRRVLGMMSRLEIPMNGEITTLVSEVDGLWYCTEDVDLDIVAQAVDTAGYGEQQRKKHQAERRAYRRARTRHKEREASDEK
jgi:hypothetical protein